MSSTEKSNIPDSLAQKVAKDIQKSGFPLELYVLNICSAKNCGRMPSLRYEYQDKVREIDLITSFENIEERPKVGNVPPHVVTTLIIECKKSAAKPWIFFSAPGYSFDNVACFLKYFSDFDEYFSSQAKVPLLAQIYDRITASHYVNPNIPRCVGYQEAFRNPDIPSDIYKAIDSTVNYLEYRQTRRNKNRRKFGVFSEFYLPVIVLEGDLFEAQLVNSEIKVQERSHLQLRTMLEGDVYIIDIVTKNHFETFFNEVERFHNELVANISCLEFPPAFVSSAFKSSEQALSSPDEDGILTMTMMSRKRRPGKRFRKSKIELKSAIHLLSTE